MVAKSSEGVVNKREKNSASMFFVVVVVAVVAVVVFRGLILTFVGGLDFVN